MRTVNFLTQIYRLLALSFQYPTEEVYHALKEGIWTELIRNSANEFPLENSDGFIPELNYDDFQAEYLNLFEIPYKGRPFCSLYEGMHGNLDRNNIIEELFRFYEYFDVNLNQEDVDYPDYLVTELEFMSVLVQKEFELEKNNRDSISLKRAQLDFIERHLLQFVISIKEKLKQNQEDKFYQKLSLLQNELVDKHRSSIVKYFEVHDVLTKEGE